MKMQSTALCLSAALLIACGGSPPSPSGGTGAAGSGGIMTTTASSSGGGGDGGAMCPLPCPLWAKTFGGPSFDGGASVAIDAVNDTVYVGRSFEGMVTIEGQAFVSTGYNDLLLTVYAPNGQFLWAKQFGSEGDDLGSTLVARPSGGVVLAALVGNGIDFGSGSLNTSDLSTGSMAVAAFNSDGSHIWSRAFSTSVFQSFAIGVDVSGNVLLTGSFADFGQSPLDFGGGPLPHDPTNGGIDEDVFLAKFDSQGNHLWSQSFPAPLPQFGNDVAAAADGTIFLTGHFEGTLPFGQSVLDAGLEPMGSSDAYVAAFSADGLPLWSASFGDDASQSGQRVVAAGDKVFVLGEFGGTMSFSGQALAAQDIGDAFIAVFQTSGVFNNASRIGGKGHQFIWAAAPIGEDVAVAVSGSDGDSPFDVDFGNGLKLPSTDAFALARFHSDLTPMWVAGIKASIAEAYGMTANDKMLVIGGVFWNEIDFGQGSLQSVGDADCFVAALRP